MHRTHDLFDASMIRSRSKSSVVSAPAKLTLSLKVTGVREDGYHLLDSEMVSIDLCDTLEFSEGHGITVEDEVIGGLGARSVPLGGENLVDRALAIIGRKAAVRMVKRIPPGAGLGGGSTDAAAVLRWGGRADAEVGVRLGADVPFCILGGRARVRGVGEIVEPLPFEPRRFVLLVPPLEVSTAEVYRAWDERARRGPENRGPRGSGQSGKPEQGGNDLEAAALEVSPELALWRSGFAEATGLRPRLAGSGSTWFVEGDSASLGLENRQFLVLGRDRAPLVEVRTLRPVELP